MDRAHVSTASGPAPPLSEHQRTGIMLGAEAELVDMVTRGDDLNDMLGAIARSVERISSGTRCLLEVSLAAPEGPVSLLSSQGPLDPAEAPQPVSTTFASPIVTPAGGVLGRLLVSHPARAAVPAWSDDVAQWATRLAAMAVVRAAEHQRTSASVALLAATLESTVDGILVVDASGRIAGHNDTFAQMWHIDPELLSSDDDARVMGSVLGQLVDPAGFVDQVQRLYSEPNETSFDELAFLDGRVFERYSQPQRVDGLTVGRVWSFRDVTDTRLLERELHRQTRMLELLGTVAGAANSATDVRDALSATLESFSDYWGAQVAHAYLVEPPASRRLSHSVWWPAAGDRFADFRAVTESTDLDELGLPMRVATGSGPERLSLLESEQASVRTRAALRAGLTTACAFPVLVQDEIVGVLEFLTTETHVCDPALLQVMHQVGTQLGRVIERDRAARGLSSHATEMERLTRRLESVLNSAGEGICGVDQNGAITFVNKTGAHLLGADPSSLIGRDVDEVVVVEDDSDRLGASRDRLPFDVAAEGSGYRMTTGLHRRPDGTSFDCELVWAPIVEGHAVVGSVMVFRDISERRAVDRMKDEFVSVVSHELRTPLTSIRGSLGLLAAGAAGPLPSRAARMVDVASTSAERLGRLVNDILDVERLRAGRLTIEPVTVEAGSLVRTAVLETAGLAESRQVEVRTGSVSGLVLADPDRVVQVLTNLVGNAIKFSSAGSTVSIDTSDRGMEVRFDVRDDGPGIPSDQLETVFERFRQADASDSRQQGGTGLGLAISRALVEQHGGRIWATSAVGRGATFSFTLPSHHEAADPHDGGGR